MDTSKVTRVELIDYTLPLEEGGGRTVIKWQENIEVELSLQDDERTLKIFIKERDETDTDN